MHPDFFDLPLAKRAFLGKALTELLNCLHAQAEVVYRDNGVIIPAVGSSTLLTLYRLGPLSLADIAAIVKHPHQTIAQHLARFAKLGLTRKTLDPNDRRRSEISLTDAGRDQSIRLETALGQIAEAYDEFYAELGCDVSALAVRARKLLADRPLQSRIIKSKPLERPYV